MGFAETRIRKTRLALWLLTAASLAVGGPVLWHWHNMPAAYGAAGGRGAGAGGSGASAAAAGPGTFDRDMKGFLNAYCVDCHAGADAPAGLDLTVKDVAGMAQRSDKLTKMVAKLTSGQMPPKGEDQPKKEERAAAVAWLQGFIADQIKAHAGDPGVVLAHRLNNAEYNYTIKDLTGEDIEPAKEFPVDPANQAGFDNSGESLVMDPELAKKYLEAARSVSEHLVFQSDGVAFAPDPAISTTDRDKYAVNRIMAFYKKQPVDLTVYFLAAWHYENRVAENHPAATLDSVAAENKVSAKYLKMIYAALTDPKETVGPLAAARMWWQTFKDQKKAEDLQFDAFSLAQWVHSVRAETRPVYPNLNVPGMQTGSQSLVIWKVRQLEASRFDYSPGAAADLGTDLLLTGSPAAKVMAAPTAPAEMEAYEASFTRFAKLFPDEFMITERAPVYLNPNSGEGALKGHFLNAGLHSQTGYFRDDRPLCELILSDAENKQLDAMWDDLYMVTDAALRQFQSMIWFERSDSKYMVNEAFNFVRSEDNDLGEEPKFSHLRDVFVSRLPERATAQAKQAVADYFDYMQGLFKRTAELRERSQSKQLDGMLELAARAYRRPLTEAEKQDLLAFYHTLRKEDDLDHEEALRDVFVSVLMSPDFCYLNLPASTSSAPVAAAGNGAAPLGDYELASRLSYFLWSSMPDAELLGHAAKGDLHEPQVLLEQSRRMLADDRVVNLATEFGGNWLDFRQFETHNGVDRGRFPEFDNDLREAMFQEPVKFLTNLMQHDGSMLDVLYGDYTFVNAALAKHYGMNVEVKGTDWQRVDGALAYERGGILPMAVFLTKNSPGLRTSPVKRGYWVVKRVLGEEIPAPPPNVPALPPDESKMDLPLPQMLARHRADPNCAICHVRFDSMGLVFEGFGPVGESRKTDMAGKAVENTTQFPDGETGTGLEGLRKYIKQQREGDYVDNLCRKLLAAALGRTLILSDETLVGQMRKNLEGNGYKFGALVNTIVTSPQFLTRKIATPLQG